MTKMTTTQLSKFNKALNKRFFGLTEEQIDGIKHNVMMTYLTLNDCEEEDCSTGRPYTKAQNFEYALTITLEDDYLLYDGLGITSENIRK